MTKPAGLNRAKRRATKPQQPTNDEIEAEIIALNALYGKVRRKTFFNEDNWAAIEAQVRVLKDRMSDTEVYATFGEEAWTDLDTDEVSPDYDEHEFNAAMTAAHWLWEGGKAPSVSWKELMS